MDTIDLGLKKCLCIINTNMNQEQTVTGASGRVYTAPNTNTIRKLSDLSKNEEYIVVAKNPKPTRFGTFVVTIGIEEDDEIVDEYTTDAYMPEYIAKYAEHGKCFVYQGLKNKNDSSGHKYRSVIWWDGETMVRVC